MGLTTAYKRQLISDLTDGASLVVAVFSGRVFRSCLQNTKGGLSTSFAPTSHALRLMEKLAASVEACEPVLLVSFCLAQRTVDLGVVFCNLAQFVIFQCLIVPFGVVARRFPQWEAQAPR